MDNVLYSCDFSEKMCPPQPPPGPSKLNPLVKTIREIVDKRRGVRRKMQEAEEETTLSRMTARSGKVKFENKFHIAFSLSLENAPIKDVQYAVGLPRVLVLPFLYLYHSHPVRFMFMPEGGSRRFLFKPQ